MLLHLVTLPLLALAQNPVSRVAIVGAGAGGSSAAFWIKKAQERSELNIEIDVYERSDYIGGRSTTVHPYDDPSYRPVEIGASIFVEANKNLWRAADEFNLTRTATDQDSGNYGVGVWDGEQVVLSLNGSDADGAKLVDRYGAYSLQEVDELIADLYNSYLNIYTTNIPRWSNISALSDSLNFTSLTAQTIEDYFRSFNVSDVYTTELVEGAIRINYGQDSDKIDALEGLAAQPPPYEEVSILGGNFQIFEQFLKYSNASVHLNTTVTSILPSNSSSNQSSSSWTVSTKTSTSKDYDVVILAAPYHQTGPITVSSSIASSIPEQPYVHLHVTLLSTSQLNASTSYFHMSPDNGTVPNIMLTTANRERAGLPDGPTFNSMAYYGKISESESYVKIFSKERMEDEELDRMFDGNVGWVFRKEWDAYPYLPPTKTFPPIKLASGFYYVNAFEPFMSTMETETISSRNVVDLMLDEVFDGMSICGSNTPPPNDSEGYVYGFDC